MTEVSTTTETPLPKLKERVSLIYLDPFKSNKVLVLKDNPKKLFGFDYIFKSGSLDQAIHKHLLSFGLIKETTRLNKDKLFCVYDKVTGDTVDIVYLSLERFKEIPNSLEYVKIKDLTSDNNEYKELYLSIFLKIFADLELASYFKF